MTGDDRLRGPAPAPLLTTKLFPPPLRPDLVPRPQLLARLDAGLDRRITLVSAPAGFGKSTLLSAWAARLDRPVAWLSLDEGDRDATRLLSYLAAALQQVDPALGAGVPSALRSLQAVPPEVLVTILINDVAAWGREVVLVLDDVHLLDGAPTRAALELLVERLPPNLHLALGSRADPPLPLARLRARGTLSELRAADLRFTQGEAGAFLRGMELALAEPEVAALKRRTEGWVAGLQLAALSLQGRADTAGFVHAFAGDDRYVVDYLLGEVLERQPADVRRFLLQTAILERMSGPLCDAVTGGSDGAALLEVLERSNLFVVPLDDQRRWYRYHHLFADVLRAVATRELPGAMTELHRRASAWYAEHDLADDAVRHAFAAGDPERAADLIEWEAPALRQAHREATLLRWLEALPADVLRRRPVLIGDRIGALLGVGRVAESDALADAIAPLLEGGSAPSGWVVANDGAYRALPSRLSIYRAVRALGRGDVAATADHAQSVLDRLEGDDLDVGNLDLGRGAAGALLALARWAEGDLEGAYRAFADALETLRWADRVSAAVSGSLNLSEIRTVQGRLHAAERALERGLEIASEHGDPAMPGAAGIHAALSELHIERGDLAGAARLLERAGELATRASLPENRFRHRLARARLLESRGDPTAALPLLEEAERLYLAGFSPEVRPIHALTARLQLRLGEVDTVLAWALARGLTADDAPTYLRECEHLTLARALIARHRRDGAADDLAAAERLLDRLDAAAEAGGRGGSVLEIGLLRALVRGAAGDLDGALERLGRALALAEPEGYVRLIVDEGAPMAALLREAEARGVAPTYVRRLLAAFDAGSGAHAQPLDDPLTPRELEVLRLIAEGCSNREIGERLYRALDTVKGYNRSIFAKLATRSRTEAVARARELGLL